MRVVGKNRGYLRTGGYYGRFTGRRNRKGNELKFFDTILGTTTVANTGNVATNLCVVPQDATESGRIGRKITIKSISIRGQFDLPSTGTVANTSDAARFMLVQDRQANGAAFAVLDVLSTAGMNSHRDLENESRFRILKDFQMDLNAGGGGMNPAATPVSTTVTRQWKFYVKCNIPIEYDSTATTGAIGTQRSNSIAPLFISDIGVCTTTYVARIRYTDES